MKFLHLADLHIGKKVNEFSMIEDQKYILKQILNIIDEEKIEAVLIAGDVYDKQIPSTEAVKILDEFLNELAGRSLPTFIIAGNHDSAERIGFGAELISRTGIHIAKPFSGTIEKHVMSDEYGTVNIYMLPFIKPALVRPFFAEEEIRDYQEAVRTVIDNTEINRDERNILIAHQFVNGADRCESEEITVGGLDQISVELFETFDYVALGHLHSPQKIGENARYAGSPLKYSFSEANQKKAAVVIDVTEKGNIEFHDIPLVPMYDMKEIKGTYMDITAKSFYDALDLEDYFHITLTDEEDVPEAMAKLRTIYPKIMKLDYDNKRTRAELMSVGNVEKIKEDPLEIFKDFYEMQNGVEMSPEQVEISRELMEKIQGKE